MSIHKGDGIAFSIMPEDQREHFRLLELPPELLQVLTSDQPQTIQFKTPRPLEGSTHHAELEAVLCTPDQTYTIRQVNTSNSVYICQPVETTGYDGTSQAGLQAIAQSSWTLELSKAPAPGATSYMKPLLPMYTSTGTYQSKDLLHTKNEVFDNMPESHASCQEAWKTLAAFQLSDPKGCFRPTASARVLAWQQILETAVATGIDLTDNFDPSRSELVLEHDGDWPVELILAVAMSMTNDEGFFEESKCVSATGLNLLESKFRLPVREFLDAWRDSLPEKWRAHAKIDALSRGMYALLDNGKDIAYPIQGGASYAGSVEGKSTVGAKRKWHDKFRASKKTA